MHIRSASLQDIATIDALVREATRQMDARGIAQWDELYPTREILAKDIERGEMHVIESEGGAAGIIVLNEHQEPEYAAVRWWFSGPALVVHRLAVHPAFQRRGLASRLMDFAEERAAALKYACVRLDAFTKNPAACSLYESRGYRKAGTVRFRKGEFFCFEKAMGHKKTAK
jgi:ribosomal protein S18 acetylase RimI-like enzyme